MKTLKAAFLAVAMTLLFSSAHNVWAGGRETGQNKFSVASGTNTTVWIDSTSALNMPDGIVSKHETFVNPIVSSGGVITVIISTLALQQSNTTFITGMINPKHPQAIIAKFDVPLIGVSTFTLRTTMTIVGVGAQGQSIRERVQVSTTWAASNNAFLSISSITFNAFDTSISSDSATVFINVGSTATFGLAGNIGKSVDVYGAKAWNVSITSSTANSTFDTFKLTGTNITLATFETWYRDTKSSPPRPK